MKEIKEKKIDVHSNLFFVKRFVMYLKKKYCVSPLGFMNSYISNFLNV